ncbi:MAG: alpha/beta fold hydrolase [Pseudomonadota bacterium]
MIDLATIDYAALDCPEVLNFLFHPRPDWGPALGSLDARDIFIPVAPAVTIGARLHPAAPEAPNILFFHGNGEIVSDYDELGAIYRSMGINFLPVDYRGYGRSSGSPSVTHMMRDCHRIFDHLRQWLKENGYWGPVIVMGRSLGSASAVALAAAYPKAVAGLIIESGFAHTEPLLRLLGVNIEALGLTSQPMLQNIENMRQVTCPTLVIHAENDHIIPFTDGENLFIECPIENKRLLKIPHADHNNIMAVGFEPYMASIRELMDGHYFAAAETRNDCPG